MSKAYVCQYCRTWFDSDQNQPRCPSCGKRQSEASTTSAASLGATPQYRSTPVENSKSPVRIAHQSLLKVARLTGALVVGAAAFSLHILPHVLGHAATKPIQYEATPAPVGRSAQPALPTFMISTNALTPRPGTRSLSMVSSTRGGSLAIGNLELHPIVNRFRLQVSLVNSSTSSLDFSKAKVTLYAFTVAQWDAYASSDTHLVGDSTFQHYGATPMVLSNFEDASATNSTPPLINAGGQWQGWLNFYGSVKDDMYVLMFWVQGIATDSGSMTWFKSFIRPGYAQLFR